MEQAFPPLVLLVLFVGIAISLASFALWIWSLVSVVQNPTLDSNERLIWILAIVITGVLGSMIYLIAGRNGSAAMYHQKPPSYPSGKNF